MKSRILLSTFAAALVALFVSGCGGGVAADAPDLHEAYGTIKLDGAPMANVRVSFSNGNLSGVTNSSGGYTIAYNDKLNGAFPGKTTVTVVTQSAADMNDDPDADDEDDDADFEAKESPSGGPKEWNMEIEVTEDGAPYDFDLKTSDAT